MKISGIGNFVGDERIEQPKRKRRYSYDPACGDLALYFLTDGKHDVDADTEAVKELAQAIQDLCEDHCRDFERS